MSVASKMMQLAGTVARKVRTDGWSNVLTGLGITGRDKRMSMDYNWIRYTESELEHLYAVDSVARRIVEYVPNEGCREWIEFKAVDQAEDKSILMATEEMERLCVQKKFNQAWNWARLYGGAGALMVVDDGKELDEPLVLADVRQFKSLTVLNRFELPTAKIITNLEDANFGRQELYDLAPRSTSDDLAYGTSVHHTRIIRFDGMPLPRRLFEQNDNWDDSVLPKILNALRNYNMSHDSLAMAISDFRLTILKLKDLADMVGSDDDTALMARLQLMNISKGILNSVAIDADSEEISHLDTNFSNLDKVIEKVEARLVADSDMPHTIVLGEGAQGALSGGGQSEDRNSKGLVAAQQEIVLTHPINRVLEVIQAAKQGPFRGVEDEGLSWDFKPLWQQSEKEKADIHFVQAQADEKYYAMGALSPENIARSRFGGAEYSTETKMEEAFNESSNAPKPANSSSEQDPNATPGQVKTPGQQDDADKIAFDHAHSGWLEGVGYYYTGGANGEGDNHTHQLPNGVDTGPAIPLFGGGHMHQLDHANYTGPGFALQVATEAQAVMAEAAQEPAGKQATVELELDLKTGKFSMKSVAADRLVGWNIDNALPEKDRNQIAKRMGPIHAPTKFKGSRSYRTNIKGLKVTLGDVE